MGKSIFISYSRCDEGIVFPFIDRIERELGPVCWIDKKGIESGSQFEEVIVCAIENSKVVLFMLSDKSIDSKWTKREVLYAEDEGKRIVPVVLDGGKLRKWFKFHFGNVDYIDIRDEEQCEKLLEDMAAWIGVNRNSQKGQSSKGNPQIEISSDGSYIILKINELFKLVLKKDTERNCYVGEIPVQEILDAVKERNGDSKVAAMFPSAIGSVMLNPIFMLGALVVHAKKRLDARKKEIFDSIVSELNHEYDINLREKGGGNSSFFVELGIQDFLKITERI